MTITCNSYAIHAWLVRKLFFLFLYYVEFRMSIFLTPKKYSTFYFYMNIFFPKSRIHTWFWRCFFFILFQIPCHKPRRSPQFFYIFLNTPFYICGFFSHLPVFEFNISFAHIVITPKIFEWLLHHLTMTSAWKKAA